MALRSNMWSSSSLERGIDLARSATLSLEADPDMQEMRREFLAALIAIKLSTHHGFSRFPGR